MTRVSVPPSKILPACGEGDRAQRGGGGFGLAAIAASFPNFASSRTPPPTNLRCAPVGHLPTSGEDLIGVGMFVLNREFASGLTPPPSRLRCAPAGHLPTSGEDL